MPPGLPVSTNIGCRTVALVWGASSGNKFPVHKYRLQRRWKSPDLQVQAALKWLSVYVGADNSFTDRGLQKHSIYEYRVQV
jgi:hypothetical protein